MDLAIQEIVNQIGELTQKAQMELDRFTHELAKLENLREDLFSRLSREGKSEHLRKQLEETDEKIADMKRIRQEAQKAATEKIQELRLLAEKMRDQKINELKRKYEQMAEERDALRDEVIPELEQEIQDLTGKKKNLDSQMLTLTSEINALNRLDIQVPSLG